MEYSVLLKFRTHYCSVCLRDDRIYCMSYTDSCCDFDVFDDLESASEFALTQPRISQFQVEFEGE